MDIGKEPVSFIIEQGDIGTLLAGDPGLLPNSGSAFSKVTPVVSTGMDRNAVYGELLGNRDFLRSLRIIAQPDLYGTVRISGAQGLTGIRFHRKNSEGSSVAVTEQDTDGRWVISLFDDYKAYLAWWMKGFVGPSESPTANFIPPKVSLEEFLFVLHAVDSFRRVSYQNMLSHVFSDRTYVKVPEFLRSMADSLKSLDIRWLLPAFLAVTPGVEQYQTAIDPQNIAILLQQDFFTEGKLDSGEDALIFGEAGQIMGVEFFRSWFTSCGLEINVSGPNGFKTAERLFIAPTVLANHFARLEDAGDGKAMVNHQAYTTEQLTFKLDELFGQAFAIDVMPVRAKSDAAPSPAAPSVRNFCVNCGSKVLAGAVFCDNCGTKI